MRAVILCAGLGTRARPFTLLRPKPLLSVGGSPLLERTIQYLLADNITDITLVTGYKAEMFEPLGKKYGLRLLYCEEFAQRNNHASLLTAAHLLDDCIIMDGDLYLRRGVFKQIQPGISQFVAQKTAFGTEWELHTTPDGRVTGAKKGSPSGWAMSGLSYWTGEAAKLLRQELPHCTADEYWEDAALRIIDKTPVYMTPVEQFQVEMDDCYDLIKLHLVTPDELAMQCDEQGRAQRLGGLTNSNYLITLGGERVVLRIPGLGSEKIIDRTQEPQFLALIKHADLTPPADFFYNGIKVTQFLEGYETLQPEQYTPEIFDILCSKLRQLHSVSIADAPTAPRFCVIDEMTLYERQSGLNFLEAEERDLLTAFAVEMDADPKVFCHRDLLPANIMVRGRDMRIIDFEYACFTSLYWDIASFLTESRLSEHDARLFAQSYGNLDFDRVQRAVILVEYIWALWGFVKGYIHYGRGRMAAMHTALEHYTATHS